MSEDYHSREAEPHSITGGRDRETARGGGQTSSRELCSETGTGSQ